MQMHIETLAWMYASIFASIHDLPNRTGQEPRTCAQLIPYLELNGIRQRGLQAGSSQSFGGSSPWTVGQWRGSMKLSHWRSKTSRAELNIQCSDWTCGFRCFGVLQKARNRMTRLHNFSAKRPDTQRVSKTKSPPYSEEPPEEPRGRPFVGVRL